MKFSGDRLIPDMDVILDQLAAMLIALVIETQDGRALTNR
ncbi:hypothetical protein Thivi_0145 [Thiocystis violascens DSM 198]|uniref:Uncharacterized protein n=1 Tax=Thiocystis violascens (strain ATCC 17096 / DSM 198 / 6111) TaxID=765911 RepID=I3Y5F3_THIV6|nr:hypothetical protein Thivi_0145 [Thiocystis violascens DSM 198]